MRQSVIEVDRPAIQRATLELWALMQMQARDLSWMQKRAPQAE